MAGRLSKRLENFHGTWRSLPASKKGLVGGISSALLVGVFAVTLGHDAFPEPEFFVGNVPPDEREKIISYLRDQGVGYDLDEAGNIYVHSDAANLYWEYAAQQPEWGIEGYSWLRNSCSGMTRDQFNETSLQSHQEALAKAIVNGNPKILTARVFLAAGKEGLFPSTSKGPTASVNVTARGGGIDRGTVEGIQTLVAGSITGLEAQSVRVIADGKPLESFREQTNLEA